MDVKELRIGNYVSPLDDETGEPLDDCYWRVTAVARNHVYVEMITEITRYIGDVKPFDLTHDILLNIGFNHKNLYYGKLDVYEKDGIRLEKEKDVDTFLFKMCESEPGVYIKHLHHLQNLFMDLKNIDLRFDEKTF